MDILPQVQPHSYEWQAMWFAIGQHPINQGLDNPKAATCPTSGESWQYMDSGFYGPENDQANTKHCFRHRLHPLTQQREYLHIPVSRSYLHTTFTSDQPNPGLLIEWIHALQANFVPRVCGAYSGTAGSNCTTGLLLNIAGLLHPEGGIDFRRVQTIMQTQLVNINHTDIEQLVAWLLDLKQPQITGYEHFFYDLQELNDKPGSTFPFMADHLLAQPFIRDRYDQLMAPSTAPVTDPDAAFNAWMQQVDEAFLVRCGFTSADLDDQTYFDYFEDGMQPEEVVDMVLEELGYPGL